MRFILRRTLPVGLTIGFLALVCWQRLKPPETAPIDPVPAIRGGGTVVEAPEIRDSQRPAAEFGGGQANPAPDDQLALSRFDDWAKTYLATVASDRGPLVARGEQLAAKRRGEMRVLIETDPEQALNRAIPMAVRQALPPTIVQQLEERVGGRGDLAVVAALPDSGELAVPVKPVDRFVSYPGKTYRAFVYGRRLPQSTTQDIPLFGVAIDDALALHESPVRALEAGEVPDPALKAANAGDDCPVSRRASDSRVAAQVGDKLVYLCTGSHIAALGEELAGAELAAADELASAWSQGSKTVLFIRINYPDDLTESISETGARTLMTNVGLWFGENSYGTTDMATTVTPLLTLPKAKTWYKTNDNYMALLADARTASKAAGFDTAGYDLDCVHFASTFSGWSGRGYVGGKGVWLQSGNSVGVACHELGHNYGLWHANYWNAPGDTIIGPGSNTEYGNVFDTMGSASAGDRQFNAFEKNVLSWIPSASVLTVTNSGLYHLCAFDVAALTDGLAYALKVRKDTRDYWVELRQKFTANKWIQNGVLLNWGAWSRSAGGSQLLDTTPGSPAGNSSKDDAALVVGRTFSDPFAGIHITPLQKKMTTPPSMDVMIHLGFFPENRPPTVTVSASTSSVAVNGTVTFSAVAGDPDGDSLAYYWDFGDQSFGTNGPTAGKMWGSAGRYVVRCIVSDMKGGTSSHSVLVTVGAPTTYSVSGRVTADGLPLDGVRVSASSKISYTDGTGSYTLTGLGSGDSTVSAVKPGFSLTPVGFANPITLGPSAANIDFIATAGTYSISGQVTDNSVPIPGVVVGVGTNQVTTGANGRFTLSDLRAGTHPLVGAKPGYELSPDPGWNNPVAIEWGDVTNRNLVRPLYTVSGVISGINGAAVVSLGETNHQTTAFSNRGAWNYALAVPKGQWNLVAALGGFIIKPSNFTNPVAVAGASVSNPGYNFSATPGTSYSIAGGIFEGGQPVPGIRVTSGPFSATTDSVGCYQLTGLTNGTYALVPSATGYTFAPASLGVAIAGTSAVDKNFLANASAGPLSLTGAAADPGGFQFAISGPPNHLIRIEASLDLKAWETVATISNSAGEIQFVDMGQTNSPRFYRAVQLP